MKEYILCVLCFLLGFTFNITIEKKNDLEKELLKTKIQLIEEDIKFKKLEISKLIDEINK